MIMLQFLYRNIADVLSIIYQINSILSHFSFIFKMNVVALTMSICAGYFIFNDNVQWNYERVMRIPLGLLLSSESV